MSRPRHRIPAPAAMLLALLTASPAAAQDPTDPTPLPENAAAPAEQRPFVRGGIYDKPFVYEFGAGTAVGGYLDVQARFEREEGVSELSFSAERFNVFFFSPVSEVVRLAAELEVEEAGEEIKLELAAVDIEIHPALVFRAGMLLSPLGRFNLAHDSPAMALVDRPLPNTEILATTLSEVGFGLLGAVYPWPDGRITWEVYAVNGFSDGILSAADGTRIPAGRRNLDDNNFAPSVVGRLAVSPWAPLELGFSAHVGPYNTDEVDGLEVDDSRLLTLLAADAELRWEWLTVLAELAFASIEVPEALQGLFAERQLGGYLEVVARLLETLTPTLPRSSLNLAARWEQLDLDGDIEGDSRSRLLAGVSFRPHPDTAIKLDYFHDWARDRFDNLARTGGLVFGVATYF